MGKLHCKIKKMYTNVKRDELVINVCFINKIVKEYNINQARLCHSGKRSDYMKKSISDFIEHFNKDDKIFNQLLSKFKRDFDSSSINKKNKIK